MKCHFCDNETRMTVRSSDGKTLRNCCSKCLSELRAAYKEKGKECPWTISCAWTDIMS